MAGLQVEEEIEIDGETGTEIFNFTCIFFIIPFILNVFTYTILCLSTSRRSKSGV